MNEQRTSNSLVWLKFAEYARTIHAPTEYEEDPPMWRVRGQSGHTYRAATLVEALRDFWDSEIRHRDTDGKPIEAEPVAVPEPPPSEIEAEIMEQLAQRPHDRLCVEALALIQRLRMRAPSAPDPYDCAACDQPGEHCSRPHGICRRAVPPPGAAAYDRDKYPHACLAVQAFADNYVNGYEMICEDEEGREGTYTPNGQEDMLIRDAINGLISDEDFVTLVAAEYAERQAQRAAEGCCLTCGCPAGDHYVKCTVQTKEVSR